jgi:maltooligosyltrehalose synthase
LGQAVWEDSAIELPSYAAGRRYLNVFTGETLEPAGVAEGGARLPAASVLAHFPLALLVAFEPGRAPTAANR